MHTTIFICPVCRSPLVRGTGSYVCENRHSYDISKDGYVNLLLANMKQSREPGDSKEMLESRKLFLDKGYYKPLARSITSLVIKYRKRLHILSLPGKVSYCARRIPGFSVKAVHSIPPETPAPSDTHGFTILDAGCGEGYYSEYISKNHYAGSSSAIYGIDISREGIRLAAKRKSSVNFAVAGIYNMPVMDRSVDILMNIFAPFNETEFARIIKDNGIILSVTPGARHLYELKKSLYDDVYLNDEEFPVLENFRITETVRVQYELNIHDASCISNLLKMTPYYHKTGPQKIRSFLENTAELKTTADFVIRVITKMG